MSGEGDQKRLFDGGAIKSASLRSPDVIEIDE
jgi:hypothetical protein